ncbi:hypothetical protein GCM10009116_17930 [Brevundimonas basaltis]|uniref:Putative PurR-regulated permease PerM n=1 Tax=Brevundimonas basaltis TaxID=472166 RepID=A0A7W8HW13_9CAUL|nr:putative PurR-regulated permease PerM [Brevundimonas basaltis]
MASSSDSKGVDPAFARRTLYVFGVAAGLFLIWQLSGVLLLAFSAVIVAVLLRSISDPIAARTPVSDGLAVALAGLIVVTVLTGSFWLSGPCWLSRRASLRRTFPPRRRNCAHWSPPGHSGSRSRVSTAPA